MKSQSMNDCHDIDQRIGKYHLLQQLGQSNMSEVYIAEDKESHEHVVLKLLYGHWEGESAQKFLNQSASLIHLQHPHIVPTLDYGIENGLAFMVLKYVPKGSLRQLHPRGNRLPLATIIQYVRQITQALQYIHDLGLVHRDIKPHNLLVGTNDEILLSDFGATIVSHSLSPIHASLRDFEGTAPYAAPEQLQGKPRRGSDQYALGIVVYEWLSGDWPFTGTFHEITHQHLFVAPPSFENKGITCPKNIEQVIMRTLEKEPEKRYPQIKHFADELEWAFKIAQARGELASLNLPEGHPQPSTEHPSSEATEAAIQSAESQPLGVKKHQFKSPLPFRAQ